MDPELEKSLVGNFLATRSEAAFRQLYRMHADRLYKLAMRLCCYNAEMAEDVLQEAWLNVVKALPGFRWQSALSTWLISITVNCYKNYVRKTNAYNYDDIETAGDIDIPWANSGQKMDIESALRQLPPRYREVLVLHDYEGYKHEEIAGLLGISPGTSRSQLFHARRAIKKILI